MTDLKENITNVILNHESYSLYIQSLKEICDEIANIFSNLTDIPRHHIAIFPNYLEVTIAFFNPKTLTNNHLTIDLSKIRLYSTNSIKKQIETLILHTLANKTNKHQDYT